jgi:hypothetical protein
LALAFPTQNEVAMSKSNRRWLGMSLAWIGITSVVLFGSVYARTCSLLVFQGQAVCAILR